MTTLPGNIRVIDMATPGQVVTTAPINSYSALAIPAYKRAMTFLSENMAAFPRSIRMNGAKRAAEETAHLLDRLLSLRANTYQNPTVFWQALFLAAAHYSNGYAAIERDAKTFQPIALHNLAPESVTPFRYDKGDGAGLQQYYVINRDKVLSGADVIHVARFSYDGMSGMNPFQLHEGTLRRASLIQAYVRAASSAA